MSEPITLLPVTAVTVTYGDRKALLRQMLDVLPAQGVARVVVVDNGASWPVKAELAAEYGDFVDVVEMGRNIGSAPGFAAGIQRAMDLAAEFIWLLDDDNKPASGCLSILMNAYQELRPQHPADLLVVNAYRQDFYAEVSAGVPARYLNARPNSFRGFHVLDIPYKFWKRTPWGRPSPTVDMPTLVRLDVVPYSGMLFHRAVPERFGLPRRDFVLYSDDTEFSYRITRAGGIIMLVTSARLEDMEALWSARSKQGLSFNIVLNQGTNFRVYYSTRNGVYLDAHCKKHDKIIFIMNGIVYLSILMILAIVNGKRARLYLILEAIRDGWAGRLGMHPDFPLQ
jgi:GT2 family glycosyltransferase